mmetsp:Transcript_63406/g.200523  ORF Transcript_63406/g.200523 Transcript_63406/m.200523 type:complete len:209 (-) Transcript_63406:853-1479(-)
MVAGVGHHHSHLRIHQPHHPARGTREVARTYARVSPATPHGDHLRNQPPIPAAGGREMAQRPRAPIAHVTHRGDKPENGAHGVDGGGGIALRQRRGEDTHLAADQAAVCRLRRDVAGQIPEQNQRGDPPPVGARGKCRAVQGVNEVDGGRRMGDRYGSADPAPGPGQQPRAAGGLVGGKAGKQGAVGGGHREGVWCEGGHGRFVRRAH